MGHDVKYLSKLTPKLKLNEKEIEQFKELQDDCVYNRLYALKYNGENFQVDDSNGKLYPDKTFDAIEKYVLKLKEGGNDIKDGGCLVSCSEYGIDDEAIVLLYKNGEFKRKTVLDLIKEWTNTPF